MSLMSLNIGGAETHVVELCRELSKQGIDVSVASAGGVYVDELEQNGIKHFTVPLNNKSPKNIIKSYFQLKKIIKENKFDVVHAHARIPAFICSRLQKRLKFPFVTTAHGVFNPSFPWNILTNWGEKTLAVSEDIRQYLLDNYRLPSDNISITINGIDAEKFSGNIDYQDIAKEFEFSETNSRILYVSRLEPDRSLPAHELIKCAPALCRDFPNLEIVIAGGGMDFDNVKAQADSANAVIGRRAIILTGGRTDINKFIASANIFIGVARAALEAAAAGIPAILAGSDGYIGILDETTCAAAVETNFTARGYGDITTEMLERDIRAVLAMNTERLNEISAFGREMVVNNYSVTKMANDALLMYRQAIAQKRPLDVLISGYYGYGNSGDDALLKAMINSLRELKEDISITVLSQSPADTAKTYGVNAVPRFKFLEISKILKRTKLLISGGGSLIQDITSRKSLMYYLWIIKQSLKRGAKVMLYANGIGPVVRPGNKRKAAKVLRNVDMITLRDEQSREVLENLGLSTENVIVTADPAFCLEAKAVDVSKICGFGESEKYCVISVRPWKENDAEFEQKMAEICNYSIEKHKILPLFLPMQPSFDLEISNKILRLTKAQLGKALSDNLSVEEILGIIARAEFVIGMRLHTLIYSASMGVPVIGLVYDPKVGAFMDDVSQAYKQNVENIDVANVCGYIDEIMQARDEISERLAVVSDKARDRAKLTASIVVEMLQ